MSLSIEDMCDCGNHLNLTGFCKCVLVSCIGLYSDVELVKKEYVCERCGSLYYIRNVESHNFMHLQQLLRDNGLGDEDMWQPKESR